MPQENEPPLNDFGEENNQIPPQEPETGDMQQVDNIPQQNNIGDNFNNGDTENIDGYNENGPIDGPSDEPGDDSTMSIINQLSDTDREAVRAYAESMLNRDETQDQPMQENLVFTKKQLDEIHEILMAQSDRRDNELNKINKKTKQTHNLHKSPFDSPFI